MNKLISVEQIDKIKQVLELQFIGPDGEPLVGEELLDEIRDNPPEYKNILNLIIDIQNIVFANMR